MAGDYITFKIHGADEAAAALRAAAKEIRVKAVRSALRPAANKLRNAARGFAPVLQAPRAGRKPGTVRDAIVVRRSKRDAREGNEGVFVGVKPLSRAKIRRFKGETGRSGHMNPNDPYYWPFVEFGHRIVPRTSRKRMVGGLTGYTVYQQRLRNGKIVTRRRKYRHESITGRRRAATRVVLGRFFMTRAARHAGQATVDDVVRRILPAIKRLNARTARAR